MRSHGGLKSQDQEILWAFFAIFLKKNDLGLGVPRLVWTLSGVRGTTKFKNQSFKRMFRELRNLHCLRCVKFSASTFHYARYVELHFEDWAIADIASVDCIWPPASKQW